MDLDAFVAEHGAEWNRLGVLARKRRRRLSAAEVDELVVLYRRAATHLSVVRTRAADPTLVAWLSQLVLLGRSAVTPSSGFSLASVTHFFAVAFPTEIVRAAGWIIGVATGFLALAGALIVIVAQDSQIALTFMNQAEIDRLVNNDFEAYYSTYAPQNFAALVWTNNAFVSAVCLAGGVLVLPSLYMLWTNVLNLGVVGGVMVGNGRAEVFFGLITIHGLLELTCVFIAAGAGLRVAWAWIAPGPRRTRAQALGETGRSAMVVALGLVVPLFVSGLVEAFLTPAPLPVPIKLAGGALVWLAFLGYVLVLGVAGVRRGASADVAEHEREAVAPAT